MASTRADSAMLSHSALLHVPTNGRTASDDRLNGAQCQITIALSWIGGQSGARNGVFALVVCLDLAHSPVRLWIDRPYGECRLKQGVHWNELRRSAAAGAPEAVVWPSVDPLPPRPWTWLSPSASASRRMAAVFWAASATCIWRRSQPAIV